MAWAFTQHYKNQHRAFPNLEIPDNLSIWCLEVHSDNPKCPQSIKECLIRREEQLKASQQMQLQKANPKPRNQRGMALREKKIIQAPQA